MKLEVGQLWSSINAPHLAYKVTEIDDLNDNSMSALTEVYFVSRDQMYKVMDYRYILVYRNDFSNWYLNYSEFYRD